MGGARMPIVPQRENAVRDAPRHTQLAGIGTVMKYNQINIGKNNKMPCSR